MEFPRDHKAHNGIEVEWWYVWGKTIWDEYFHWVLFKKDNLLSVHDSVHGKTVEYTEAFPHDVFDVINWKGDWFYIYSPQLACKCIVEDTPVIHKGERSYYSIPRLFIDGLVRINGETEKITALGWFDHEWGPKPQNDWTWISMKFNDGDNAVIYEKGEYKHILKENGYKLMLTEAEKIFYPSFGWPYSEQPFTFMMDGKPAGYGMMERTYKYRS